jgi:hypothetical protein
MLWNGVPPSEKINIYILTHAPHVTTRVEVPNRYTYASGIIPYFSYHVLSRARHFGEKCLPSRLRYDSRYPLPFVHHCGEQSIKVVYRDPVTHGSVMHSTNSLTVPFQLYSHIASHVFRRVALVFKERLLAEFENKYFTP